MKRRIKIVLVIVVLVCLAWFLVLSPILKFHENEKIVEDAARRYFEHNSSQLPTGKRIKTLSLKTIYHNKFLDNDIYAPLSTKTCSLEKSWVKVRRENNEYKYYTYLDCGIFKSSIDAVGPVIKLNGDENVTVGLGEEFNDPGIKSVVDNTAGKLNTADVIVSGKVDTSKTGIYEISYVAFDNLNNKGTVTRTINVVQKVYSTVKKSLGDATNYVGIPDDNYVRLSNMMFHIYGVDTSKNVVLVADSDVANVSYSKIDKWLDYYYDHLNKKTKEIIVPSKYCNMNVDEAGLNTTECSSYTKNKKVYIPSIVEVNKSKTAVGDTFMKPYTMSWVATGKDDKEAYVTRNVFFYEDYGKSFLPYNVTDNYGVRPMFTIKGDTLITGGDGSYSNPFVFSDTEKVKKADLLNTRYTGEYIQDGSTLWRIIDVEKDGTVKAISNSSINGPDNDIKCYQDPSTNRITYNPKDKRSVGYYINNKVLEYVETKKLVEHEIKVPIYKNKIIYGDEIDVKKYKVMLSAPNMFEMFSAYTDDSDSYWCLNTSQTDKVGAAITEIGVPMNELIEPYTKLRVRVVGYFNKNVVVSSGDGTLYSPYRVK